MTSKEINFLEKEIETILDEGEGLLDKVDLPTHFYLKGILEALLFASSDPLPLHKMREVTDAYKAVKPALLKQILKELGHDYLTQQRAFRLEEIAEGYLIRTHQVYSPYIELLYRSKRAEKLTQAAAEVLAIIIYKQPVTRPQIDAIRGVDSSGTLQNLMERELIEPVGKLEAPGRPTLYGIAQGFLKHFGLKNLKDLPKFEGL